MQYLLCICLLLAAVYCLPPNGSGPSSPTSSFSDRKPTFAYQDRVKLNNLRIQRLLENDVGDVVPDEGLGIAEPIYAPPMNLPIEKKSTPGRIKILRWDDLKVPHHWEKVTFRSSNLRDPVLGMNDWATPVDINSQGSVIALWVPKYLNSVNVQYRDMQRNILDATLYKGITLKLMKSTDDVFKALQNVARMIQYEQTRSSFDIHASWITLPLLHLLHRTLQEITHDTDLEDYLKTESLHIVTFQERIVSVRPLHVQVYLSVGQNDQVSRRQQTWTVKGEVFYVAPILVNHKVPVFRRDSDRDRCKYIRPMLDLLTCKYTLQHGS